jgi:hypothetical protein
MNKAVLVGVLILITIGIGFAVLQLDEDTQQDILIEENQGESKNYVISLTEEIGVLEDP